MFDNKRRLTIIYLYPMFIKIYTYIRVGDQKVHMTSSADR